MYNTIFEQELELIQDPEIRYITEQALENVNPKFYKAAASSTGKYHPEFALGDGGLVRHTKVAVMFALELFELWNFTQYEKDLIISSLILHDTCKSGKDWHSKYTVMEHPLLVESLYASEDEEKMKIWNKIVGLVKPHMGKWNKNRSGREILPTPKTNLEKFVHLCDYLASRKWINVKDVGGEN